MTNLEELKQFNKELQKDPNFVDVKFFAANKICKNVTDEQIARDALILLKGGKNSIDISDEIL